ncbi:MAG: hypothetical protein ACTSW1_08210 [Candidatus Hodarchaeales archaeon]
MARELETKTTDGLGILESISSGSKFYYGSGANTTAVLADVGVAAPRGSIYFSTNGNLFLKTTIAAGDATDWDDVGNMSTSDIADGAVTAVKLATDAVETLKIKDVNVTAAKLATDSVETLKIKDANVTLAKLAAGIAPTIIGIAAEDAYTTDPDTNVDGLASAIALANSLKTVTNAHGADAGEHTTAIDNVNYPVTADDAVDLATVLALTGLLLTAYDVHDADAELGSSWAYHAAQEAGDHSLTSAVTPTTLAEATTRLNDLKAKLNAHDADGTTHGTDTQHQEATADSANGAAILVPVVGVASGDIISWSILNDGTGSVTGVSAAAGTAEVTFTFSADPQNDSIISYSVHRTAA